MDLVTLCPFVASKLVWQAHSGVSALTVIVKATFLLRPGTSTLAPDQDPISEHDQFHDDDPRRSVRIPNDLVPYKPSADVLLIGRAYAPGNQPVRSLVTRFVVGDVDKSIEVWCDRAFRVRDGQLLEGKRFTDMPLMWERASGGPDSANPVGKRFDGAPDAYGTIAIANLQPLGHFVSKRSDTFAPTCYAPIAATWPERIRKMGPLSRAMFEGRWQDKPLPPDLEPTFFLAAPPDQHMPEIRPNERIILENLHADHPRLVTNLPGLKPRAIADRATGEREEITLVGDTLWVDTNRGVCCVVWRGRIGLRHPQEAGRIAVWVDGLPMADAVLASGQTSDAVAKGANLKSTMFGYEEAVSTAPVLPFVPGSSSNANENDRSGQPAAAMNQVGIPPLPSGPRAPSNSPLKETKMMPEASPGGPATPFEPRASTDSPLKQTRMMPESSPGGPATPFEPRAPTDSPLKPIMPPEIFPAGSAKPLEPRAPMDSSLKQTLQPEIPPGGFSLPFGAPSDPGPTALPDEVYALGHTEGYFEPSAPRAGEKTSGLVEPNHFNVAPPPMIGPLAKVDMGLETPAPAAVSEEPARAEEPTPVVNVVEPHVVELPIEQTAAIAAELAEGHMARAKVLDAHDLDERAWKKNEERWKAAIEDEQGRGKSALRATYDAAYVKRVEGFRGAITVNDYARILVAIERRKAPQVLQELKIQRPAQMPIIRIWVKKVAQNRNLGDQMAEALKAARNTG